MKISTNSFLKTLVNMMKLNSTKVSSKSLLAKKYNPALQKHCSKIDDISLVIIRFFFSQANLVFKLNPVFIDILDSFWHSLFKYVPFKFVIFYEF